MSKFTAVTKAFGDKSNLAMLAIFRESAQRIAHEASVPRAQGGNMPVDTGFLRNSIRGSTSSMPGSESEAVEIAILSAQLGDTLYIGWTANYAIYMEARYGYMRLAAQNWKAIVNEVAKEVTERLK